MRTMEEPGNPPSLSELAGETKGRRNERRAKSQYSAWSSGGASFLVSTPRILCLVLLFGLTQRAAGSDSIRIGELTFRFFFLFVAVFAGPPRQQLNRTRVR